LSLGAGLGVVVRYFPLKAGEADYVLFVDRKAVGVIEAKPEGTTLSGVSEQTERYLWGLPESIPSVGKPLRFAYESTGVETFFLGIRVILIRCLVGFLLFIDARANSLITVPNSR
jgi:type I restriction enzyme R subunit